jgi:hypothetical protein
VDLINYLLNKQYHNQRHCNNNNLLKAVKHFQDNLSENTIKYKLFSSILPNNIKYYFNATDTFTNANLYPGTNILDNFINYNTVKTKKRPQKFEERQFSYYKTT